MVRSLSGAGSGMAKTNNNTNQQVWNVREDDSLSGQVSQVIALLLPRGLLVAGFSLDGDLLTLHYTGYNNNRPIWELAFFEQLFAHEPLLANKANVKGVFILPDRQVIIPDELYDKTEAENWLRKIHFIERTDVIQHYAFAEAKAHYLIAVPVNITELIRINFNKATILPASVYQFRNIPTTGAVAQFLVSAEQIIATLHHNGKLLWHNVFDYNKAEDIAYPLMQVIDENLIPRYQVSVRCNGVSAAGHVVISNLSQYFPGITTGDGYGFTSGWEGAISLAIQLFTCA